MLSQLKAIKTLGWQSLFRIKKLKRLSQETIRGFYTTRVVIALFNIGLFDELAERQKVNLEAFAAQKKLDLTVLKILCNYLYSLRILTLEGENYSLDPKGELLVDSLSGAFYVVYAYEDIFYHLEALLKQDKAYGKEINRRSEFVAKGSSAVGKLLAFPLVADALSRNKFKRILDLGCGDAKFLINMCQGNGHLTGYGIDISTEAIALGHQNLKQENLQDNVQLFVGDIFKIDAMADQLRGIDAATCIYVLHEFQDRIPEVLRSLKQALPGVPLIICEVMGHTPEVLRQKPGGAIEIQLFHELSNQQLFSRKEWHGFFRQSGYTNIREDYLAFVRSAIFTIS